MLCYTAGRKLAEMKPRSAGDELEQRGEQNGIKDRRDKRGLIGAWPSGTDVSVWNSLLGIVRRVAEYSLLSEKKHRSHMSEEYSERAQAAGVFAGRKDVTLVDWRCLHPLGEHIRESNTCA